MTRLRSITAICVVVGLSLTACGGDGGDGGNGGNGGNGGIVLTVTAPEGASTTGFAETTLSVAADTPFTIHFINDDTAIPHNVQIFEGSTASGEPAWAPPGDALITGPDETDYEIPALSAGTYAFNCLTHPTTMVGTLTVG
jgi:plastocyanin